MQNNSFKGLLNRQIHSFFGLFSTYFYYFKSHNNIYLSKKQKFVCLNNIYQDWIEKTIKKL